MKSVMSLSELRLDLLEIEGRFAYVVKVVQGVLDDEDRRGESTTTAAS
jgi:hypothetical protein